MKRRRMLQVLPGGLGVGAASQTLAQTAGVELPPAPGAQRPLHLPPIGEQRLANGLTLLVAMRRATPLVTASLAVRAGREHDPRTFAGLAAMTANLLVKGARRGPRDVDAATLARQAEALGSGLDVTTGWRTLALTMTVTTPKLVPALELMSDVLRAPLLQADELERLRAQSLDSLKVTLASPGDVAGLAARRLFWGDSVYGGSATPASLQRLALPQIVQFQREWLRPDRSVLILAGDIEPDAARQLAQRVLGEWAAPASSPEPLHAQAAHAEATQALVIMPGSGQSGVVIAAPYAALGAADRRAGEVASALLAGGYSSRLNQEVRIKRGLSYGAFGGGESHSVGGMFTASAQTKHASAREVVQLMRDEMARVAREVAPTDELTARKATLIGSFVRQLETTAGLAGQVASQYFQDRPVAELGRYVDDIQAVSPEQVRAFAEQHWAVAQQRSVIAGEVAAQGDELQVPIAALDLEQALLKQV